MIVFWLKLTRVEYRVNSRLQHISFSTYTVTRNRTFLKLLEDMHMIRYMCAQLYYTLKHIRFYLCALSDKIHIYSPQSPSYITRFYYPSLGNCLVAI